MMHAARAARHLPAAYRTGAVDLSRQQTSGAGVARDQWAGRNRKPPSTGAISAIVALASRLVEDDGQPTGNSADHTGAVAYRPGPAAAAAAAAN